MTIDPTILAAIVSLLVALLTSFASFKLQEMQLRSELKLEFATEAAIRQLLTHEDWTLRSFEEIKRRFKGIDDNDLRKFLIRSGALSFDGEKGEMWGLRERNKHKLG